MTKRAQLIIDLGKYQQNLHHIRQIVHPAKIMAVVKANAYGLGAIEIAKAAENENVDYFAVAWQKEAEELRQNNIKTPILLFSEPDENISHIIKQNITPTVYTSEFATQLDVESKKQNQITPIHIKIDTGMSRYGVIHNTAIDFIKTIQTKKNLVIEGVYTHLANADRPEYDTTNRQLSRFKKNIADLKAIDINPRYIHCANSHGIRYFPDTHFNLVRPGIMTFENIVSIKSVIHTIKHFPKNTPISYNGLFETHEPCYIATIGIGYADGIPQTLKNHNVLINDHPYPIVGKVCMDTIMINLGQNKQNVSKGDIVTIVGQSIKKEIPLQTFCKAANISTYALLTNLGTRPDRLYINSNVTPITN